MSDTVWKRQFGSGLEDWWVEGGQKVWTEEGELHVLADPEQPGAGYMCTVWCRTPLPPEIAVTFRARVVHSHIAANNINLFLGFRHPSGAELHQTRQERSSGEYALYHELNGVILTYLNDFRREGPAAADGLPQARMRIRRCPGFRLLAERFAYHCREGVSYRFSIVRRKSLVRMVVDQEVELEARDPDPASGGLLGFRTFRSHVAWSKLCVGTPEPLVQP